MNLDDMSKFKEFFDKKGMYFLKKAIRTALEEDGEDVTSRSIFSKDEIKKMSIVAKEDVVIAGLPIIPFIFQEIGSSCKVNFLAKDGDLVKKGEEVSLLEGPVLDLLLAERIILNFLCHLSGIATYTKKFVNKAAPYNVKILDTRKTLPGLRYLEKYAVVIGGGENHRFGLDDMVMIKDNHIDAVGSVKEAIKRVLKNLTRSLKIVVECRSLQEVKEAINFKIHRIMLDNMDVDTAKEAMKIIPSSIEVEISGGVDLSNIEEYAKLRPNYISIGRIIHSAKYADLSMKLVK